MPAAANTTPLACTITKFQSLKAEAQTIVFVRIGSKASKTLFKSQETLRVDATSSTVAKRVITVLKTVCDP